MLSTVDTATPSVDGAIAAVVKPVTISTGVSVSRLNSGCVSVAAHRGEMRVIVELTPEEFRDLIAALNALEL